MTKKKPSDERLALELFDGRMVRTKKGRLKLKYLSGSDEQRAKAALARVIDRCMLADGRDARHVKLELMIALTPGGAWRQLVFQSPRRGRPATLRADLLIRDYVAAKEQECGKTEAAIEYAMKEFGLEREAIYAARRRWEKLEAKARKWPTVSFNRD